MHFHKFSLKTWISIQIQYDYLVASELLEFQTYFS